MASLLEMDMVPMGEDDGGLKERGRGQSMWTRSEYMGLQRKRGQGQNAARSTINQANLILSPFGMRRVIAWTFSNSEYNLTPRPTRTRSWPPQTSLLLPRRPPLTP